MTEGANNSFCIVGICQVERASKSSVPKEGVKMKNKFFAELSRRLYIDGIESSAIEDKRLEVFLHSQPVLYVSPASDIVPVERVPGYGVGAGALL